MLNTWIRNTIPAKPILNLYHITSFHILEEILKHDEIIGYSDSTYSDSEKVTYFFYGVAAYRYSEAYSRNSERNITSLKQRPIGIRLKPEALEYAKICHPFDTGAYLTGRFCDFIGNSKERLNEYSVSMDDSDNVGRIVRRYFGNNDNYLDGASFKIPRTDLVIPNKLWPHILCSIQSSKLSSFDTIPNSLWT